MTHVPNPSPKINTEDDASQQALHLLQHMRRSLLSTRENHELWNIAFGSGPITAVHLTTLARIRAKLEGRRAA